MNVENKVKGKQGNSRGVTLVALVVTIVILIILATVSISALFGENGLIKRAQEARNHQSNAIAMEQGEMEKLAAEYANVMAGGGSTPEDPVDETVPLDDTLIKNPKTVDGMTPVKYVDRNRLGKNNKPRPRVV